MQLNIHFPHDFAISLLGVHPREMKNDIKIRLRQKYSQKAIHNSRKREAIRVPKRLVNRHGVVFSRGVVLLDNMKELLCSHNKQTAFTNVSTSERSQMQEGTYCTAPFIRNSRTDADYTGQLSCRLGVGGLITKRYKGTFGVMEMFGLLPMSRSINILIV